MEYLQKAGDEPDTKEELDEGGIKYGFTSNLALQIFQSLFGKQGGTMYHYQNLEHVSLHDISRCLNAAFSDYSLPVRLSEADLSGLFLASGIDRRLSFGAFFEGQLVGCILNSRGIYQGCRAAFDVPPFPN